MPICASRRLPYSSEVDISSQLILKAMDRWAYKNRVTFDVGRHVLPVDNARVNPSTASRVRCV